MISDETSIQKLFYVLQDHQSHQQLVPSLASRLHVFYPRYNLYLKSKAAELNSKEEPAQQRNTKNQEQQCKYLICGYCWAIKLTESNCKIQYFRMLEQTYAVLREFQAHQGAVVESITTGTVEKRPGQPVKASSEDQGLKATLKHAYEHKLNAINKTLEQKGIDAELDAVVQTGGKFKDFGLVDNVWDQGKTQLAHRVGEVLLVDVWATWCGPCQKPMQHNQEMLEKNQGAWGHQVRIIGLSVDDSKEVVRERVTSRKWDRVLHLTLLGWQNEHPFIKHFGIGGIPFVCLVNKWGNIVFSGHPSEMHLESRINDLLAEQVDTSGNGSGAVPGANTKDSCDKVLHYLHKQFVEKQFKDIQLACFKYTKSEKIVDGKPTTSLQVQAYIAEGDHVAEDHIRKLFGGHVGVTLKVQRVKYVHIPQVEHPECSICKKAGLNYPYYWLKWEEGVKFGCRTCVEKKSAVAGHHHAYEKNSVLLMGKHQKVAEKDLGKNLQPKDVTTVVDDHEFGCDGCGGSSNGVGHARYICLGIRDDPNFEGGGYCDFCDVCIEKVVSHEASVLANLQQDGYNPTYPFLRILYNTAGYYEF